MEEEMPRALPPEEALYGLVDLGAGQGALVRLGGSVMSEMRRLVLGAGISKQRNGSIIRTAMMLNCPS